MGWFSKDLESLATPIDAVGNTLDKLFTSDEERSQADAVMAKLRLQPQLLQLEINKVEASHRSIFVSGWRPAIGWICVTGLGWHFVGYPITTLIISLTAPTVYIPPVVDADNLMSLVVALLGLGAYRTYEKVNNKTK